MAWILMVALYILEADVFTEEILFVGGNSARDVKVI